MSKISNLEIYNKIKDEITSKYKPSAYRSALMVKRYKETMEKLGKPAYSGKKNPNEGLKLWFDSKWTNQRGEQNYKYKSDVYRPTIRVNASTPTTWSELTPQEIKKAREEKARTGRVKRFKQQ